MIVYYTCMRAKDENKRKAISAAAIKLINELGFDGVSVSKIAREADVSPATIYIYFENKEAMINQLYNEAKFEMSAAIIKGVDFSDLSNIKAVYRQLWFNQWDYYIENPEKAEFIEQFTSSPYINQINKEEGQRHYQKIYNVFNQGIKNEIIRNMPLNIILSFAVAPLQQLAKAHIRKEFKMTNELLEKAFTASWDALKT